MEKKETNMWQNIFMDLVKCKEKLQPMWQQFQNLPSDDISGIFLNNSELFGDEAVKAFKEVSAKKLFQQSLMEAMTDCGAFNDNVWKNLFLILRDRESKDLDRTKTVAIIRGGRVHPLTVEDLEDDFMKENPSLMTTQTCIPAELNHDDSIDTQLSTKVVENEIKLSHKEILQENMTRLRRENPKQKEPDLKREAEKKALDEVKQSREAKWVQKRISLSAEFTVQKAIERAAKMYNLPVIVLRGVKTLEEVASYLSELGIETSPLGKITKKSCDCSGECEHDIVVIALSATGVVLSFVQVKTRESELPWELKDEEQKVDKGNVAEGNDQLKRDALRFLELVPDIKMAGHVDINLMLAFPLAPAPSSSNTSVLTREDFEEGREDELLKSLGIKIPRPGERPLAETQRVFKRIGCRYVGAHSQVPSKNASEAFKIGLHEHELAVKGTDSGFKAVVTGASIELSDIPQKFMKVISCDPLMQQIRSANENAKFRNKFQEENPGIHLKKLKLVKNKRISDSTTGKYPVFGKPLAKRIVELIDAQYGLHQGSDEILKRLVKENIQFFTKTGEVMDTRELVDDHVSRCEDCKEVAELVNLCPPTSEQLVQIPNEHVLRALEFADRKHQGFAEAYNRIKSWCDFPDFKERLREYIAECCQCGQRTARMMLSQVQIGGIKSKKHTIKFIVGHYGTGKSVTAQCMCREEVTKNAKKNIFYVCFSKNSTGEELINWFKNEFESTTAKLKTFTRKECCQEFDVDDIDDNISVIEKIVSAIPEDSVIVFDETPFSSKGEGRKRSFDWSSLTNKRKSVTVIVSLQPVVLEETIKSKEHEILYPTEADVVELTQQYRSSTKILSLVNAMCRDDFPIEHSKLEATPSHDVTGPDMTLYPIDKQDTRGVILEITSNLHRLNCLVESVKFICDNSGDESEVRATLGQTNYANCTTTLEKFQGSEVPVAVVISPKNDDYSRLLEMCSRAQYKLFIVIIDHPRILKLLDTSNIDVQEISTHVRTTKSEEEERNRPKTPISDRRKEVVFAHTTENFQTKQGVGISADPQQSDLEVENMILRSKVDKYESIFAAGAQVAAASVTNHGLGISSEPQSSQADIFQLHLTSGPPPPPKSFNQAPPPIPPPPKPSNQIPYALPPPPIPPPPKLSRDDLLSQIRQGSINRNMNKSQKSSEPEKKNQTIKLSRDDLLSQIRQGVSLKSVNRNMNKSHKSSDPEKKNQTIKLSAGNQRTWRKIKPTDFLQEIKDLGGATGLRRVGSMPTKKEHRSEEASGGEDMAAALKSTLQRRRTFIGAGDILSSKIEKQASLEDDPENEDSGDVWTDDD